MSLRRHHAAPALEVSVLGVAAGVSKGRCAATTRPLPSASHTSISTSSGVVPRVAHQRCAAADDARRGRHHAPRPTPRAAAAHHVVAVIGARAPPSLLLLMYIEATARRAVSARATATSQAPVREAWCFLGFPLDFYFRGTKYVQHFEGLYLRTSQSIALACSYFFFSYNMPMPFFLVLALLKFGQ